MCDARLDDEDVRETSGDGVFGFRRNMEAVLTICCCGSVEVCVR